MDKKKIAALVVVIIAFISLITGIVLSILGFVFCEAFDGVDKERMTEITQGEIVQLTYRGRGDDRQIYATIEFEVDGQKYYTSPDYSSSTFREGKIVNVYYDPSNPKYSSAETPKIMMFIFKLMKYAGISLLGVFGICVIVALILLFKKKKDVTIE